MDTKSGMQYENGEFIIFLDSIHSIEPIELKEDTELIDDYIEKLELVYNNSLRHFYSDINIYILEIEDEDIDYLVKNLLTLHNRLIDLEANREKETEESSLLRNNILKIIDHIRLIQIRSMNFDKKATGLISDAINAYYESITNSINKNLKNTNEDIRIALKKVREMEREVKNVDNRLKNINIDIITVLSIFSAVIISFFGGLNFIGQALVAINNANPKLTIIVITISGIIMFNIIYFLFWIIGRTIGVPINFECKEENCYDCEENCNFVKSLWKRHTVFVAVNVLLLGIIVITYLKLPGKFTN